MIIVHEGCDRVTSSRVFRQLAALQPDSEPAGKHQRKINGGEDYVDNSIAIAESESPGVTCDLRFWGFVVVLAISKPCLIATSWACKCCKSADASELGNLNVNIGVIYLSTFVK